MIKYYSILTAAIVFEVIATTSLARSENFTRLIPTLITVAGYAISFWCLSFPLRVMPTGIVYAIWSGMGIIFISAIAWVRYRQSLDFAALLGIAFILLGVVIINLFSKSMFH